MDLLVGTEWAVAMSAKDTVLKSRRPEEKRTKNRNREGEKVALANQHTFDIVFIIKLQHQADSERESEKQEEAKQRASVRPAT
jgi:hypothetical protein